MHHIANPSRPNPVPAKRLLLGSLIVATMAFTVLEPIRTVYATGDRGVTGRERSLAGSWHIVVGEAPGPVFEAFETFTEAGGSVETNNGPGGGPVNPGIGSWTPLGQRQYLATLIRQNFDADGQFIGTTKVRRLITMQPGGDQFTGRDRVDIYDPAGNRVPLDIPAASFIATRLTPEALD